LPGGSTRSDTPERLDAAALGPAGMVYCVHLA